MKNGILIFLKQDAYKTMLGERIKYGADIVEGACRKILAAVKE